MNSKATKKTFSDLKILINNDETNKKTKTINNNKNSSFENKDLSQKTGKWDLKEHILFLKGCLKFGNNWKKIESFVKTRTSAQIRSHAQKYLYKLKKKYINNNTNLNDTINNENIEENSNLEKISKISENSHENIKNKNENIDNFYISISEINDEKLEDNDIVLNKKFKLKKELLNQLLADLEKPDYNLESVEKIILKIFCFNEDINENEILSISDNICANNNINIEISNRNSMASINDSPNSNNNSYTINNEDKNRVKKKGIFLCKKLKREKENNNYEKKVDELMNSNDQEDLKKLCDLYFERDFNNNLFLSLLRQLSEEISE